MLMPLSGPFHPVCALPDILQPIGRVLPLTHIFAAARAVLDGHALPWDELAIAAVGALVLAVASVWFVVRMLAVFPARGYISRYVLGRGRGASAAPCGGRRPVGLLERLV